MNYCSTSNCLLHVHLWPPLALRILRVVLIKVTVVCPCAIRVAAPGAIPEMVCLAIYSIRRRHNLDQVPTRDLDRWDLGRRQPDEVREDASNDGCVSDDEQVLFLPL